MVKPLRLTQRKPGPVAIQKGLDALIVGMNQRDPGRTWRITSSPLDSGEGTGAVGTGNVKRRLISPDDQHPLWRRQPTAPDESPGTR